MARGGDRIPFGDGTRPLRAGLVRWPLAALLVVAAHGAVACAVLARVPDEPPAGNEQAPILIELAAPAATPDIASTEAVTEPEATETPPEIETPEPEIEPEPEPEPVAEPVPEPEPQPEEQVEPEPTPEPTPPDVEEPETPEPEPAPEPETRRRGGAGCRAGAHLPPDPAPEGPAGRAREEAGDQAAQAPPEGRAQDAAPPSEKGRAAALDRHQGAQAAAGLARGDGLALGPDKLAQRRAGAAQPLQAQSARRRIRHRDGLLPHGWQRSRHLGAGRRFGQAGSSTMRRSQCCRRASPFPAPPGGKGASLTVPIRFR